MNRALAMSFVSCLGFALALGGFPGLSVSEAVEPNPPASLYWCPNKNPDQRVKTVPEPGCVPLHEKKEKEVDPTGQKPAKEARQLRVDEIEKEVSSFLHRYRKFLDCCANDTGAIGEVEELEDQASTILRAIQETGLVNMSTSQRGITLREIIQPVTQGRDDLRKLRQRLHDLAGSKGRLKDLDYEQAGAEQKRIQEQEEALRRDFRPTRPPDSARTGTEIQDTTVPNRIGTLSQDSTVPNATGTEIGGVVSPNTDQQKALNPRRGLDTQDTTLPTRFGGPTLQDTTLPNSFGADIGTQQNPAGSSTQPRVGPDIGDSSLNRR